MSLQRMHRATTAFSDFRSAHFSFLQKPSMIDPYQLDMRKHDTDFSGKYQCHGKYPMYC